MRAALTRLFAAATLVVAALGVGGTRADAQPAVRGRAALATRPTWALGDSADADAIVRVVVENGPQVTLMALGRDTMLLLPVRQLFALLEVALTDDVADKRLIGLVDPDRPPVGFDTERGLLLGGRTPVAYPKEAVTWQQGELYASATLLAEALRVKVDIEQSTLTVTFLSVRDLPVVRRLERQRQRAAQLRSGAVMPAGIPLVDHPARFDGLQMDWSFLSPLDNPASLSSARITLGAQLMGGGLELQQQQLGTESFVRGQTTWSWTRAWQDQTWVRQVGVGTVVVPGRRSRQLDGALITNVPYFRPADYATSYLSGVVPTGWEVDVQRYGLPLANIRPDAGGAWRYEVPVSYGPNELELVAYGPGGASRRWRANVVVPFERLQQGRFEYVAGAGACRFDLCERAANVDLRYGLTDQLTLQGGTSEYSLIGGRSVSNPFLLAAYAVRPNFNVLAEVVGGGYARAEVDYQPTTDFRVTVSGAQFDTTFSSLLVNRLRSRSRADARVFWRPTEENRGLWFALQLSHEERGVVTTESQQLSASYLRGPVRVQGGLLFDRTQLAGAASAFARMRTELTVESSLLSPWKFTRGLYGRATTLVDADGSVAQLSASVFNAVSRRFRFETGMQWVRGLNTPVVTLQMQANLPTFQAVSTMQQSGGGVVGGQTFSGTAGYDIAARTLSVGNDLANGRGVGYGAVQIDAFLDVNGNGVRDADEPPVPNLKVTVGSQAATTAADGIAIVRTLNAYVPSYVEVDTAGLPNPMWIVERPFVALVVRPNSATHLAVPVRPAGGIIGRLEFSDGSQGPTGAEIELVNVESREARRAVTYSDGSFEAFKLRPGRWEVRPSNATLRRTQSRADLAVVDVTPNGAEGFLETVTLQLLPVLLAPPATVPAMLRLAPAPALRPDTARRLDLPVPARPRRSALELREFAAARVRLAAAARAEERATALRARSAAPVAAKPFAPRTAAPNTLRLAPAPAAPRAPARVIPRAPFSPDARPSAPRPRAVRPVPGGAAPLRATPSGPDARPRTVRPTPRVGVPASPRATAPSAPSPAALRSATPPAPRATTPRAVAPRPFTRAAPSAPFSPDARPNTPRPRARAAAPARPSAATPRPKAPGAARPSPKPPTRGNTSVRPE